MKKKVALFIIFCTLCAYGYSQNLSPSIAIDKGNNQETEIMSLQWDLGESFIDTITLKNEKSETDSFDIKIASNPVQSLLKILITNTKDIQLTISLYDINGRQVKNENVYNKSTSVAMDVSDLSGGIYILKIINDKGLIVKTYKILKD